MKINTVLVSVDSNSILKGARSLKNQFINELKKYNLLEAIDVLETGSFGVYSDGVIFAIYPDEIFYNIKTPEDIKLIVEEHLLKGRIVKKLSIDKTLVKNSISHHVKNETRIVLANIGVIDPENIEEYIAMDGYQAIGKALTQYKPEEIINIIKESGLRGRGGAGFPTGKKWEFTANVKDTPKFILCNADEGEPGTFKDRLILEGDPHKVIEGMMIAGYAVGAEIGYVYIRGEYKSSIDKIKKAIEDAKKMGLLGKNIFGSGFSFDIKVELGAGAYVCGEETALIESIEGKSGRPRNKPPFPPVSGLYNKPTVVNNVETLANIAPIILNGAEWFKNIGTESSPGTKVFSLVGNLTNKGIVELPMGTTLREVFYHFGGGMSMGSKFKMIQTGGTSGTFIKEDKLDTPMDFDSYSKYGVSLGSGVVLAIDDSNCAVDIAKMTMKFFKHESCGKCTPCREGNKIAYDILDGITKGNGKPEDIKKLKMIAEELEKASFCGLGQAAAVPLKSILENFEEEFIEHIEKKECRAGICSFNKNSKKKKIV
jgi:NADH-quinone oxidoreductase subunit F